MIEWVMEVAQRRHLFTTISIFISYFRRNLLLAAIQSNLIIGNTIINNNIYNNR